jgi:ABC-type transporter Mla MlaB component
MSSLAASVVKNHAPRGVKKFDSAGLAVLVMMGAAVQTAGLADLSAVSAPLRVRSSARPLRR